jgi:DNA helicase-2/ATP-dependent DNA helicase PcrA
MLMKEHHALLTGLNLPQRQAVTTTKGPVLVLAGPGSGKTRVITHRMAYLALHEQVLPWHILAVTFTNKAAREMCDRLEKLVGVSEARAMTVGTFHAICARVLRMEAHSLKTQGLTRSFVILDRDDQIMLIKQAMKELNLSEAQHKPSMIQTMISRAKNRLLLPADLKHSAQTPLEQAAAGIYNRYQQVLRQNNSVDFDDLLVLTEQLWRGDAKSLRHYQQHWRYLHVDEFQDCNLLQYHLIRLLASGADTHHDGMNNLCVVGDDDQTIYSWRGASTETILRFEHDFPGTRVILLEQNYRSTQVILDAAQSIIKHNRKRKQKRLWTAQGCGDRIVSCQAHDERDEGVFVVSEINRLLRTDQIKGYRDVAVMARTNTLAHALKEPFLHANIPYKVLTSRTFSERKEIKDLLAYLRFLLNPLDDLSLRRIINVPNRNIGSQTVAALQQWADENGLSLSDAIMLIDQHPTLAKTAKDAVRTFGQQVSKLLQERDRGTLLDLFDRVVENIGYSPQQLRQSPEDQDLWSQMQELRHLAANSFQIEARATLEVFLENVALIDGVNNTQTGENGVILQSSKEDAVTLTTLHASKGLEYPVVFIVGLEEGSLPHAHALDKPELLEEERRLAYVGLTRAMRRLYLLHATRRSLCGESQDTEPSRFLAEIPAELLVAHRMGESTVAGTEQANKSEGILWVPGAVSDTGQDHTSKSGKKQQAHLSQQAPWLVVSSDEMSELANHPRQAVTLPLTAPISSTAPSSVHRSPFKAGMKVRHARLGEGIVLTSEVVEGTTFVEVHFKASAGKNRLSMDFDRLERV